MTPNPLLWCGEIRKHDGLKRKRKINQQVSNIILIKEKIKSTEHIGDTVPGHMMFPAAQTRSVCLWYICKELFRLANCDRPRIRATCVTTIVFFFCSTLGGFPTLPAIGLLGPIRKEGNNTLNRIPYRFRNVATAGKLRCPSFTGLLRKV